MSENGETEFSCLAQFCYVNKKKKKTFEGIAHFVKKKKSSITIKANGFCNFLRLGAHCFLLSVHTHTHRHTHTVLSCFWPAACLAGNDCLNTTIITDRPRCPPLFPFLPPSHPSAGTLTFKTVPWIHGQNKFTSVVCN